MPRRGAGSVPGRRERTRRASTGVLVTIAIVLFAPNGVFTAFVAILAAWGLYEIIAMTRPSVFNNAYVIAIGVLSGLVIELSGLRGFKWLPPAIALSRVVQSQLFDLSAHDPWR